MTKLERLQQIYKESGEHSRHEITNLLIHKAGLTYHLSSETLDELGRLSLDERIELMSFCLDYNERRYDILLIDPTVTSHVLNATHQFLQVEVTVSCIGTEIDGRKLQLLVESFVLYDKENCKTYSSIKEYYESHRIHDLPF